MNNFCEYCVGGWNKAQEIRQCKDNNCPFHSFRWANIDNKDEIEISRKLSGEIK